MFSIRDEFFFYKKYVQQEAFNFRNMRYLLCYKFNETVADQVFAISMYLFEITLKNITSHCWGHLKSLNVVFAKFYYWDSFCDLQTNQLGNGPMYKIDKPVISRRIENGSRFFFIILYKLRNELTRSNYNIVI